MITARKKIRTKRRTTPTRIMTNREIITSPAIIRVAATNSLSEPDGNLWTRNPPTQNAGGFLSFYPLLFSRK